MSKNKIADDILMHYGTKRHSGRYPWGSGDNPYQHSGDWLARVEEVAPGKSEKEVAEIMELSTGDLRIFKSIAKNERTLEQIKAIKSMTGDGLGPTEIGRKLGIGESQVRSLMKEGKEEKLNSAQEIANHIKKK